MPLPWISTTEHNFLASCHSRDTYSFPSGFLWSNTPSHKPLLCSWIEHEILSRHFLKIKHGKTVSCKTVGFSLSSFESHSNSWSREKASVLIILCYMRGIGDLRMSRPESYGKTTVTNTGACSSGLQIRASPYCPICAFFLGLAQSLPLLSSVGWTEWAVTKIVQ